MTEKQRKGKDKSPKKETVNFVKQELPKELRKQYGNYIVRINDDGITISAVSAIWSMEISIINPNFSLLAPLFQSDEYADYLESFFTMNYLMGNMIIDKEFMEGFAKLYNERISRLIDGNNNQPEERS